MKILLDINVVLDFFLERKPFFEDIKNIFVAIEKRKIEGYLCASSIDTIHYLITKAIDKESANEVIFKLLKLFEIAEVNKTVLVETLNNNFSDFEDGIIYMSALLKGIDIIVTRDKRGFKNSKIKILSPAEMSARVIDV
jgi:predicted nucleic acid-binding protein